MKKVIELISSFPTVVFTALLAFCLAWWLVSLAISGIDGTGEVDADIDAGIDTDMDIDADADCDPNSDADSSDELAGKLVKALHIGQVPLSLSLTVLSFFAWATSGFLQLFVNSLTSQSNVSSLMSTLIGIAVFVAATFAGFTGLHKFARVAQPLFTTTLALGRHEALGSTCRIRTTHVTSSLGEAEVVTGASKGQIVRVRTETGDFSRGDMAQLVGYDPDSGAFTIVELDPVLKHDL